MSEYPESPFGGRDSWIDGTPMGKESPASFWAWFLSFLNFGGRDRFDDDSPIGHDEQ